MTTQAAGDLVAPTAYDLAVKTAAEQFAARGFLGTTIEDILYNAPSAAVRDEVNRFKSKGLIASAVITAAYAGFPFVTFKDNGQYLSGLSRIAACCHAVTNRFLYDAVARGASRLKREAFVIDVQLPEPFTTWFALISEMLDESKASGDILETVDTPVTAWMLVSTFYGITEVAHRSKLTDEVHDRVDMMLTAAFHELGARDVASILSAGRAAVGS